MTVVIIIVVVLVLFMIMVKEKPKSSSPYSVTRENIEFSKAEYPETYTFDVAGVHVDHFAHQIINYCKVNDFITLEPEPENKFDKDAILVKNSYREIGYVPAAETDEVHDLLLKKHVAYISKREVDGYINVSITIRFAN